MDSALDEIEQCARRCEQTAAVFTEPRLDDTRLKLLDAASKLARAWSGSWVGYQSAVYIGGFRPKKPSEHFDIGWGLMNAIGNGTVGDWRPHTYEESLDHIKDVTGISDFTPLTNAARACEHVFDEVKAELVPLLDAMLVDSDDRILKETREKILALSSHMSMEDFVRFQMPQGQILCRDEKAMSSGFQAPHHIRFAAWVAEQFSYGINLLELSKLARHVVRYLQARHRVKGSAAINVTGKVFIGHGRPKDWQELKDFLQDRLGLAWDEFNREPSAGYSTKERLEAMLDSAVFAFLVMTAEDDRLDGTKHARENVIHEVGLFQGRLGFAKAIVLLEKGCSEFSNIIGLTQIRFPKGNILAASEDIRRVLERERIIGN
jgi:predicted nucleotide-binding protein